MNRYRLEPEEPPNLTVARVTRPDNLTRVAQRIDDLDQPDDPRRWWPVKGTEPLTWRELLDEPEGTRVLRLLPEPPEPQLPAEPPNGSVVRLWDGEHDRGVVQRVDWPDDPRGRWHRMGLVNAFLWPELAKPGWRVERLLPESDPLIRVVEVAKAWRTTINGGGPVPNRMGGDRHDEDFELAHAVDALTAAQGKLGAVSEP